MNNLCVYFEIMMRYVLRIRDLSFEHKLCVKNAKNEQITIYGDVIKHFSR